MRKCLVCDCPRWEPDDDIFCRNCEHEESDHAERNVLTDSDVVDELIHFVRTPEWSVSMLEDIAGLVLDARGDVGPDYDADDERAWRPH